MDTEIVAYRANKMDSAAKLHQVVLEYYPLAASSAKNSSHWKCLLTNRTNLMGPNPVLPPVDHIDVASHPIQQHRNLKQNNKCTNETAN